MTPSSLLISRRITEARALVDIPVIGYGQASMHMAQKLGPIVQADIGFYDIMEGYKNPQPIIDKFIAAAEIAIAQGADVIIPGKGPMNIFLATHHIHHVGNVPIIDSFGTGIKMCESLVDLQKVSGMTMTRVGYYNEKPPTEIVEKLRGYYNLKKTAADMDFGLSVRATASV